MKRTQSRKRLRFAPLGLALALPPPALAVGTTAGVDISNTAAVTYTLGGSSASVSSNTVAFRVNEILDVTISWQDSGNRMVASPDAEQVLSFLLSNTGNGYDSYSLSVENILAGDQFDPEFVDIYIDANANGIFDPALDTLYIPGSNDPLLAADTAVTVFVRNTISAGLNGSDLGNSRLIATSGTGSGEPGTVFDGAGDDGTTAVAGASGGSGSATGSYEVGGVLVSLLKSVSIIDPHGGNQPVTGARMTYRIEVSVSGTGNADGLVITDSIPANTTYAPASLTLNGEVLSDAVDSDAGDVGGSSANTVTVNLGDLTPGSPTHTVTFDVFIN